jgi:hypothetical protein
MSRKLLHFVPIALSVMVLLVLLAARGKTEWSRAKGAAAWETRDHGLQAARRAQAVMNEASSLAFSTTELTPISDSTADARNDAARFEAWINVDIIQKLVHHTSAVIAAVALFWMAGFIVGHLVQDGLVKRCVLILDEFVLLALFVYLAYEIVGFIIQRVIQDFS